MQQNKLIFLIRCIIIICIIKSSNFIYINLSFSPFVSLCNSFQYVPAIATANQEDIDWIYIKHEMDITPRDLVLWLVDTLANWITWIAWQTNRPNYDR
jgi:hypothetical protein